MRPKKLSRIKSLKFEITASILIAAFLPASLVLGVLIWYLTSNIKKEFTRRMDTSITAVEHGMNGLHDRVKRTIEQHVSSRYLTDILLIEEEKEIKLKKFISFLKESSGLGEITIYFADGHPISSTELMDSIETCPRSIIEQLKNSISNKKGNTLVTRARISKSGSVYLDYYVPILEPYYNYLSGIFRESIRLDADVLGKFEAITSCKIAVTWGSEVVFSIDQDFETVPEEILLDKLPGRGPRGGKKEANKYINYRVFPLESSYSEKPFAIVLKGNLSVLEESMRTSKMLFLFLLFAIVLVGGLISRYSTTRFFDPIQATVTALDGLSTGDLTRKLDFRLENEIGRISLAYNAMIEKLKEILSSIWDVSSRITTAGEELHAASEQQAHESKQQYMKLSDSISAALHLSEHAERIGSSIKVVDEASEKTQSGMETVKKTVESTLKKIENLGEKTKQIRKIVDLIHDIADETNLLALNAAIEAAHAGEHGAGFAVVADEVRKLADRATEATREITSIIGTIQEEISESVSTIEKTTQEVLKGANLASQTSELSKDINKSVLEQLSGGQQIAKTLKEANIVIKQFAAGTQQTAKASDELMNLALELQGLSEKFKFE